MIDDECADEFADGDADEADDASRTRLADEAARLLDGVQAWARRTFPEPAGGHPSSECQWCPLCQFMAIVRGDRPEVSERMAEAGAALAAALRALVESMPAGDGTRPRTEAGRPQPRPRVQRINLDSPAD